MSNVEAHQWADYMAAYGPLDLMPRLFARIDHGLAMISALVVNRSGGHHNQPVRVGDFMWEPVTGGRVKDPDDEEEFTPAVAMRIFGATRVKKAS